LCGVKATIEADQKDSGLKRFYRMSLLDLCL